MTTHLLLEAALRSAIMGRLIEQRRQLIEDAIRDGKAKPIQ